MEEQEASLANWQELVVTMKRKENISLSSQRLKLAKRRRKTEVAAVDGGDRIIRTACKKDRHSKVCTARGTRDRRVRLSPKTAIQFYDVQDRLGYDRPSKAIDWLMKEAKAAIDALDESTPTAAANDHLVPAGSAENFIYDDAGNGETQQTPPWNAVSLNEGNFGCFADNVAGYSDARCLECLPSSPFTTPEEMFGANTETAKMERIFTWNYGGDSFPPPHHLYGPSVFGPARIFSQWEPLQSSYSRISNYNPMTTYRFPGLDFSGDELPGFTTPGENEMDNNDFPVPGELSSTSILHYE